MLSDQFEADFWLPPWLVLAFLATGIPAIIALMFPGLVLIGYFLLIVPGLVLNVAPTAFLCLSIFAIPYVVARQTYREWLAIAIGLFAVAGIHVTLPLFSHLSAHSTLASRPFPDVAAPAPIKPRGDVSLEIRDFIPGQPCDGRCLALLFTPGVRSVTVAPTPEAADFVNPSPDLTYVIARDGTMIDDRATTFHLAPSSACPKPIDLPDNLRSAFGATQTDNLALESEWRARLSSDVCLTDGPAPKAFDLRVRAGHYDVNDTGKPLGHWSLAADVLRVDYAEIRGADGRVLMRQTRPEIMVVAEPLGIEWRGCTGAVSQCWFEFARTDFLNTYNPQVPDPFTALAMPYHTDPKQALAGQRAALAAALDNRAMPASSTVLTSQTAYFDLLATTGADKADAALVSRLLADPRVTDLAAAYRLREIFPPAQLAAWRGPIARKLATIPNDAEVREPRLGAALARWPDGLFARPDSDEDRLLSDPERQWLVTGLIARLSDRGPAAAPLLANMLVIHVPPVLALRGEDAFLQRERHRNVVDAALSAMCRIGPAAHDQLPRMLAIDPEFDRGALGSDLWDFTLARMGKPLASFALPGDLGWHTDGTVEQYRNRLAARLARYRPDRDCN